MDDDIFVKLMYINHEKQKEFSELICLLIYECVNVLMLSNRLHG